MTNLDGILSKIDVPKLDTERYKIAQSMGLLENARDKAAMAFDKMKVGATIKTSKGEFKKVDDKHFEMVEKPGRKFTAKQMTFIKEENLNEGTWSLGSANEIKDAIHTLEMWYELDAREISALFDDKDNSNFFYNVVGDDLFHDALDRAEREAAADSTDRAHNAVTDAIGRAEELLAIVRKRESSQPYPTDRIFNELLDDTPAPVVAKANNKIVNVATMAKSLLDIYDDFKAKEKIDFESNTNFRNALSFLTKAAQPQIDKETKAGVEEGLPKGYFKKEFGIGKKKKNG